jgi:hypothetical protein
MPRRDYTEWNSEENYDRCLQTFALSRIATDPFLREDIRKQLRFDPASALALAAEAAVKPEHMRDFLEGFRDLPREALATLGRRMNLIC